MIDLRYVKKLIEMLDQSTVDSLEITSDKGTRLRLSKSPAGRGVAVPMAAPVAAPAPAPVLPAAPAARPAGEEVQGSPKAEATSHHVDITSPMVGTFYQAPEPGAKAYVSVGDRIKKGQVVCIIEAMKIMNELESEFDGVVTEILVADAKPVEYGQPLFKLDPTG
jgi:acetyl-CoA carboxylase biotin carboxyl carrier protein